MERRILILVLFILLLIGCVPAPQIAVPTASKPDIGSTMLSDKDGMTLVYVPAGEFTMGNKAEKGVAICKSSGLSCSLGWFMYQEPPHKVYLDAFWVDQTEVTNAMYAACVKTGKCNVPDSNKSYTRENYYGNSEFDNYPVIFVTWEDAKAYCAWSGRRLPTEAEWEKAARGTDERMYPWGNDPPNNDLVNYRHIRLDTIAVGSIPKGVSPYGTLDTSGNVWEWVNDWYEETYYSVSPASNPLGPDSGTEHVLRGGAFGSGVYNTNATFRLISKPAETYAWFGFRCAMSALP